MTVLRLIAALAVFIALNGLAHASTAHQVDVDRLARSFLKTLAEKDIADFREAEESDLPMFHFGAGSRVRELYFGPDGEGRKALCTPSVYCDIDAQSMRIVERTWQIVHSID